jgi:DNA-binding HxlR family transcriptional regulator
MPTSPPTVEYRLSELGQELKPAIEAIVHVGHRLKKFLHSRQTRSRIFADQPSWKVTGPAVRKT